MSFKVPEDARITAANCPNAQARPLCSERLRDGRNGAFLFTLPNGARVLCIASDDKYWQRSGLKGEPWQHVSVTVQSAQRLPTWEEMCAVKHIFWDEDDSVVQIHPPARDYVNCHPYCLHLWRPVGQQLARPDPAAVGGL